MSRELEKSGSEKDDLISKIEELNLYNDSSERELKKIIHGKQNMMVDQNVLKLELKRLRDMLNERADEVFSLEKRRLQLETVSNIKIQKKNGIPENISIIILNWAVSRENLSSGFVTSKESNRPAQLMRQARVLKFQL